MRQWILLFGLATTAAAQPASAPKPTVWTIEYDRVSRGMHGEQSTTREIGRLTVRSAGDSLLGDYVLGDSARGDRYAIRGLSKASAWTIYVEDPRPTGVAVLLIPIEAAMDWLRETVHGMTPTVVRFDLVAREDSLTGTRTVTGGLPGSTARVSTVKGIRIPNP